jgi:hypothetical protein
MKIILFTLATVLIGSTCFAKTVVIYKADTKEVYSISSADDAVVPAGYSRSVMKEDMRELELTYSADLYKWNGNRLIPNSKKLDALALQEEKDKDRAAQEAKIQARIRKIAVEQLKAEGEKIDE